jgi:tRNA G18 (ribose-2'-O)-methylase SpoU
MFTKRKFLALENKQQHKKCAEVLRRVYEEGFNVAHYNEMQLWMGLQPLDSANTQDVADRYHKHLKQGEVALREHRLLPKIIKGDRTAPLQEPLPIAIYLDKIRSAYNIGSILRTTETLALGSVYYSKQMAFVDHKQVRDAAMGAEQWVSCIQTDGLEGLPKPIIAVETAENARCLYDFVFPETFTLVLGNEEYGCSDNTLRAADHIIAIPSIGRKNSLNVANAFSIVAGEIFRQKKVL